MINQLKKKISFIIKQSLLSFISALLVCGQITYGFAQIATPIPQPLTQFLDSNANPLVAGHVTTYIPNTNTLTNTWQDINQTILNTNPVTLDGAGRAKIFGNGSFRLKVQDSSNNVIYDYITNASNPGGALIVTGDGDLVGTIKPWAGFIAPNQYAFAFGQAISRITFSVLLTAITQTTSVNCTSGSSTLSGINDTSQIPNGAAIEATCIPPGSIVQSKTSSTVVLNTVASSTTSVNAIFFPYGNGDGSTTFNLPDLRGYVVAGRSNMGGVASSNLTSAFFGSNPQAIGAKGGSQSQNLLISNIPTNSPTLTLTDPGHNHTLSTTPSAALIVNSGGGQFGASGGTIGSATNSISSNTTGITASFNHIAYGSGAAISATISNGGSGYTNGSQILTISGGTCTTQPAFNVTVAGNIVTTVNSINIAGNCSVPPTMPASVTGGGGANAKLDVAFTAQPVTTIQSTYTLNYIIKITPDVSATQASGVASLGGMIGAIACGTGTVCTGNVISANIGASSIKSLTTDYGAVCDGSTDDTAAIQNAFNGGGVLVVPKTNNTCKIIGSITATKPIYMFCASADNTTTPNFTQFTTNSNSFLIRSSNVTIFNCSIFLAGIATGSATGISIGDDAVSTSCTFNATTAISCGSYTFTSADVGKLVYASVVGAAGGPLFTSIASVSAGTHNATLALAASGSSTQTTGIGFNYQEVYLEHNNINNYIFGINVIAATQYHIKSNYVLGSDPLTIQNILWSDQGVGEITGNTFIASVAGAHNTVNFLSGGAVKFDSNEVLGSAAITNCIHVSWQGTSSVSPWIRFNSIEGNCTTGINVESSQSTVVGMIIGNHVSGAAGGTGILLNPSVLLDGWNITNNNIIQKNGGNAILALNMTNVEISGNTGTGTSAIFINIGNAAVTGHVVVGPTNLTPLANVSSGVTIEFQSGTNFANLPALAKNGSIIYITDGTNNTNPCTGGGTGAMAIRINGAWVCGNAISGLTVGTTAIASGTNTRILFDNAGVLGEYSISGTVNVCMTTNCVMITPNLGTPSAATLTNATGLPVSTGISGLGTGIATFLATPSSANLASALTDETGTGFSVFSDSPVFTTKITSPLIIGGTGAGSSLTLQSTSGVGTTDTIVFKVGNNGALRAANIDTGGATTFGTSGGLASNATVAITANTTNVSGSQSGSNSILQVIGADGGNTQLTFDAFGGIPLFTTRRANGTAASKTAIVSSDFMVAWGGYGYDGAGYAETAAITSQATENWVANTNRGTRLDLWTTPTTTASVINNFRFQASGGLSVGSANVATDPGNNIILASGLQSKVLTVGTLPTCNAAAEGQRAYVSDQNTAVAYRGAVTAGGATRQAVLCSNSAWIQD